jgi:phage protein U
LSQSISEIANIQAFVRVRTYSGIYQLSWYYSSSNTTINKRPPYHSTGPTDVSILTKCPDGCIYPQIDGAKQISTPQIHTKSYFGSLNTGAIRRTPKSR